MNINKKFFAHIFGGGVLILAATITHFVFAAAIYNPGDTMNPSCSPTDPDCTVSASATDWVSITNTPTTIPGYGITDAFDGAYASLTGKPTLFSGAYADLTGVPSPVAIKNTYVVADEAARDALVGVEAGDVAVLTNSNTTYIYTQDNIWQQLLTTSTNAVDSVNDKTGIVILNSDDISQGTTNKYFDGVFASLTDKPTTLAGYGITDGGGSGSSDWASLTGKPTTIAGFGITDAFSGNYTDLTNKPTLFDGIYESLTGKPTLFDGVFSSLTSKPTTLAGYGITDALKTTNNLSDLNSVSTARTNLGLGTLATQSGTFSGTSSGSNTGDMTLGTANGLSLSGQALSLALASTSTTGALSSTDWNTFNSKGSGTVTSVSGSGGATGLTLTGGPITSSGTLTLGGTLAVASGGTGQSSYATGDLLYASNSTAFSKLADVTIGNVLRSGGVGVAPAWGKVALTTDVTGVLPAANGGSTTGANYLDAYDTTIQSVSGANIWTTLTFSSVPQLNGWTYSSGAFTVPTTGLYTLQYNAFLAKISGGSAANGEVRITKNGVAIPGTEEGMSFSSNNTIGIFTRQATISLTVGDVLRFQVAGETANFQVKFYKTNSINPISASLSIFKIN